MSENEDLIQDIAGPGDALNQIPFGLILDDPHRRNIGLAPLYTQTTKEDPDTGQTIITGMMQKHRKIIPLVVMGLSPQNNLLDLTENQAIAAKLDYSTKVMIHGLPYRRNGEVRNTLDAVQFAFCNTITGMSEEGTFNMLLTKLTGSIRELITGVRGEKTQ